MELENLQQLWNASDAERLPGSGPGARLRAVVATFGRAEKATGRLRLLLWIELLINALAAVWLGSFLFEHLGAMRFFLPAVSLHLGVVVLLVASVRQLVALRAVDWGAPVVALQKRLESLRVERVRAVRWTLLLAPLAWTPLVIVALEALLAVDAWTTPGSPWLAANLAFGLVVLAAGLHLSRRLATRPGAARLARHLAGQTLAEAEASLATFRELETGDQPG